MKLSVNDNFKLLIVWVCMPCDSQLVNQVNVEYEEVINCVEGLILSTDCNGVLLCGDWNTSFERDNAHTKCLNEFIDRCNVKVAWKHTNAIYDNTYVNHFLGHWSCIYHCIVSDNVFN